MSLRFKLILVSVLLIVASVTVTSFLGYRESKWKIKGLARELLISKTEQAFALCDRHYKNRLGPSQELVKEIKALHIAQYGYIAVIGNDERAKKGVLVIHPTDEGKSLYNEDFPHITKILDEIDSHGGINGYSNFTSYRQGTIAQGRQGEKKIGYYKYFAPWKWVILATGYEKDVFSSRDQLRETLIQLVGIVMLLDIVLIYLIIRQMFKPVQRLTESTQEVARGNWDISIEHRANDEIGVLAQSFNSMVQSLRENARIWHEFNVARDMQSHMLPDTHPRIDGLRISAKSIPTKEVGGDFYDFLQIEEGKLGIVVGDVSGHGVSAAMVMTAAMSAMRFAAEEKRRTDEVLTMVNARLHKDIQNHMFVALFYGIFDPVNHTMRYTNAGQTLPFLLRDGEIRFLPQAEKSDRFPLGIVQATTYEQLVLKLKPGDKLIFYTDGIVDAMNGSDESYGFHRFSASIRGNSNFAPDEMVDNLIHAMHAYCGETNVHDDVTLVILELT
ncbi:MAG: SpoIIE family protein phosphatase [bacterium]